jgi:hypothetical protein
MSDEQLIESLHLAGWAPDPDLVRRWQARAPQLIPELMAELAQDTGDPDDYADVHAAYLLIDARAEAALPVFADVLRDPGRDYMMEWLSPELAHYGTAVIPYLRQALFDEDVNWYGRATAAGLLTQIALAHPEEKPAIVAMLRQLLPPLDEAGELQIEEGEWDDMWTWAALELAHLQDEASLPQVEQLFAQNKVDTGVLGPTFDYHETKMEEGYPHEQKPFDLIAIYEALQEEEQSEGMTDEELAAALGFDQSIQSAAEPRSAEEPHSHDDLPFGRKVGRNEPCPCGSGKKYKHCHGRPGGP